MSPFFHGFHGASSFHGFPGHWRLWRGNLILELVVFDAMDCDGMHPSQLFIGEAEFQGLEVYGPLGYYHGLLIQCYLPLYVFCSLGMCWGLQLHLTGCANPPMAPTHRDNLFAQADGARIRPEQLAGRSAPKASGPLRCMADSSSLYSRRKALMKCLLLEHPSGLRSRRSGPQSLRFRVRCICSCLRVC